MFELFKGVALYEKGDYVGSREFIRRSIDDGNIDAQKAMGILCSKQPWVCKTNKF